jgi:glycyl-tRNA synthetase beta chain
MNRATLLVELLSEELPPKALARLGEAFASRIAEGLKAMRLADAGATVRDFASPRRLAVTIANVAAQAPAMEVTEKLMPVAVGVDAEGQPTAALRKKMAAKGIAPEAVKDFERRMDGKTETLFYTATVPGARLADVLAAIVADAAKSLPIPKVMRWGAGEATFARPVHKLTMLHGAAVVPGRVLDLEAGRVTRGHRFMSAGDIELASADAYESTLLDTGKVIADFRARRDDIERQLLAAAAREGARLGASRADYADLLDEVSALVEHPTVYVGEFEAGFLAVPQECLILTMRANQKYFPLFDEAGRLKNRFLIVSNMCLADPVNIVRGNERVVRPRLADARFFFEQDKKQSLEARLPRLAAVVYHNKLGSQLERSERVTAIARAIAEKLGGGESSRQAGQAARLAKADLLTDMVGEFPELQGVMGRYYALDDGLDVEVADAIEDHYKPRFAGDGLPRGKAGKVVALADKLETLVGMFCIGQVPSGDKDPFALRRHALGVIRILMEGGLELPLREGLALAMQTIAPEGRIAVSGVQPLHADEEKRKLAATATLNVAVDPEAIAKLSAFIFDRLAVSLRERGYTAREVDAVVSLGPQNLGDIPKRLAAVRAFSTLPEAEALASANKRVGNILKKAAGGVDGAGMVDAALLGEEAEIALAQALDEVAPQADAAFAAGDYSRALQLLAVLRGPVDAFFDGVMVNAEDPALRTNRLALLSRLHGAMNRVADLSRLSA